MFHCCRNRRKPLGNTIPKMILLLSATAICYHILACQLVMRIGEQKTKRPKNSTRYRKRAKKSADKRSGNKAPRKLDVDAPLITEKPKRRATPTKRARKTKGRISAGSSSEDENDDVFDIVLSQLTDGSDVDATTSTNKTKRKKAEPNNRTAKKTQVLTLSFKHNQLALTFHTKL